jgi:transposase
MVTYPESVGGWEDRAGAAAGATRVYVCPRREQLFLLPVSMRDWLDQGHLAWFVIDVVCELDTSGLHRRPGGAPGRPPYEPEMLCALVLYAYCTGVRSSRRIVAACRTDAAFRVICGGLVPDHATIARFVVDHERSLAGLFASGLRLCAAAGLCDLSVVFGAR